MAEQLLNGAQVAGMHGAQCAGGVAQGVLRDTGPFQTRSQEMPIDLHADVAAAQTLAAPGFARTE